MISTFPKEDRGFDPKGKTPSIVVLTTDSSTYTTVQEVTSGSGYFKIDAHVAPLVATTYTDSYSIELTIDSVVVYDGSALSVYDTTKGVVGTILTSLFRYNSSYKVRIKTSTSLAYATCNVTDYAE